MSTKAQTQAAERIGYQRGYAAGRRRAAVDDRDAFRREVFLVALPFAMDAQGWKRGDEPIHGLRERVCLAWEIADEALNGARL